MTTNLFEEKSFHCSFVRSLKGEEEEELLELLSIMSRVFVHTPGRGRIKVSEKDEQMLGATGKNFRIVANQLSVPLVFLSEATHAELHAFPFDLFRGDGLRRRRSVVHLQNDSRAVAFAAVGVARLENVRLHFAGRRRRRGETKTNFVLQPIDLLEEKSVGVFVANLVQIEDNADQARPTREEIEIGVGDGENTEQGRRAVHASITEIGLETVNVRSRGATNEPRTNVQTFSGEQFTVREKLTGVARLAVERRQRTGIDTDVMTDDQRLARGERTFFLGLSLNDVERRNERVRLEKQTFAVPTGVVVERETSLLVNGGGGGGENRVFENGRGEISGIVFECFGNDQRLSFFAVRMQKVRLARRE